jgi:AraC-like DNA-binding protein
MGSDSGDTVPLKYINTLLRVAEEQGYDLEQTARLAGLPVSLLAKRADPMQQVPSDYYNSVYRVLMRMLQDETLGISMKQPTPSGSFRMMALFVIHCRDLEQALTRAHEFQSFCRQLAGLTPYDTTALLPSGNDGVFHIMPDSGEFAAQDTDLAWYAVGHTMAVWRRFCSWLIGTHIPLREVHIQLPEPPDQSYLARIYECPIQFSRDHNGFVFDERYLKFPILHDEESLFQFLRAAPYHLLANHEVESDDGIISQMRRVVGNDLSRDFPSVVDMSDELHVSVRTLRRRLKDVGTTYQEFKDQTRRDSATRLLSRPELKINAIAALLGFDEPSAFHRSFKKWTGLTPGEYRKSLTS